MRRPGFARIRAFLPGSIVVIPVRISRALR
jgi:hypothetical protein